MIARSAACREEFDREMGTVTISYSREYFSTGSYLMRATDLNLQCD